MMVHIYFVLLVATTVQECVMEHICTKCKLPSRGPVSQDMVGPVYAGKTLEQVLYFRDCFKEYIHHKFRNNLPIAFTRETFPNPSCSS